MKVTWSQTAISQLEEIEDFISNDNAVAAARLIGELIDLGESLHVHADRGRRVPELPGSGLRELLHANYRLVYRVGKRVEILTVFEGHRKLRESEVDL